MCIRDRITIERIQDDYFLRSEEPVSVNDRATREKLLTNGDRILLNRRCSMKFVLPNPASTSAVLELTSAKLKRPDVRRIILCDDSIVMDQSRSAHVSLPQAEPPIVVVARGSQLKAKPMGRGITADQVQDHFDSGRLDLAAMLLKRSGELVSCSCHLSEASAVMEQFAIASTALQNGRFREAANTLTRLATILPKAKWISATIKDTRSAADATESLNAGPLGMLETLNSPFPQNTPQKGEATRKAIAPGDHQLRNIEATATNNQRSLLAVEGVGSFLVLRQPAIRIASASSKRTFDVGLVNAGSLPPITICLLYTSPSPRDATLSRMPSSA